MNRNRFGRKVTETKNPPAIVASGWGSTSTPEPYPTPTEADKMEPPDDYNRPPTPEEIAERAAEIRQQWSERELRERAGLVPDPYWFPPGAEQTLRVGT